ncbi:hypothetical protein TNCT_334591 [Trichonephila clavata]|uniref:Uncharacterized protein n=1 Tax=Trichonephila clavata TaxID=2740835 RepID=A0A8X6H4G2_TRICU|nr:hypothetical protein TNCT_334591 [Trichonephila clavata]
MEWPRRSTPVLLPEDGMSSCTSNTRNRSDFRTANEVLPPKPNLTPKLLLSQPAADSNHQRFHAKNDI